MQRKLDQLLLFVFCGTVAAFAIGFWLAPKQQISVSENRTLAQLPTFTVRKLSHYPQQFEAFFDDHMFCKAPLVQLRNRTKLAVWGTSGSPDVAVGRAGWLYLADKKMVPIIRREDGFSRSELEFVVGALKRRSQVLAQYGIKYLFVVAPEKHSVYPEFLPAWLKPANRPSKVAQLSAFIGGHEDVPFLNLQDSLLANKRAAQLYFKTDTHWNEFGALLAYNALARAFAKSCPQIRPLSLSQVVVEPTDFRTGDCTKLLGMMGCFNEVVPAVTLTNPPLPHAGKLLLIHDSFGDFLSKYFKQDFAEIEEWRRGSTDLDIAAAIAAKPDVVIQEVVERAACSISSDEWPTWVSQNVRRLEPTSLPPALCIIPCTEAINVSRFNASQAPGCNSLIEATTIRMFCRDGDLVRFSPAAVLACRWALIKDGAQGRQFADSKSGREYKKVLALVRQKYQPVASLSLGDGSSLMLCRLNNAKPSNTALAQGRPGSL